jgi:hypothetical protein
MRDDQVLHLLDQDLDRTVVQWKEAPQDDARRNIVAEVPKVQWDLNLLPSDGLLLPNDLVVAPILIRVNQEATAIFGSLLMLRIAEFSALMASNLLFGIGV